MNNEPSSQRLPTFINATELRPQLTRVLQQLEATGGTVILCRYNKPAAILRGGVDRDGEPVIHFIQVQSQEGQRILRAARQTA
jgi:hypothetical protein